MPIDIFAKKGIKIDRPLDIIKSRGLKSPSSEKSLVDIYKESSPRKVLPYEEFSNPTQVHGFESLSKPQQQEKIAFSQFHPANQSPTGTMVPPGTYEQPAVRFAGEVAANYINPLQRLGGPILNVLNRIGSGTALNTGLSQINPENTNSLNDNFQNNLLGNAITESIPFIGKAFGAISKPFRPNAQREKIVSHLRGNANTLEDNAREFSKEVKASYHARMGQYTKLLEPAEKFNNAEIYPVVNPSGIHSYREMPKLKINTSDTELKNMIKEFEAKPTFERANKLQSRLFEEMSDLKRFPPSGEIRDAIASINTQRERLKNDMYKFLEKQDPRAASSFKEASDFYRDKVSAYTSDRNLRKIVKGQETNPKNFHNIFEYPSGIIKKDSEEILGAIQKVTEDLSPSARNRILYSKSGGKVGLNTPERALRNLEKAEQSGYSEYYTPELMEMIKSLDSKIGNRDFIRKWTGYLPGKALESFGHLTGKPGVNALRELLNKSYRPIAKSAVSENS